MKRVFLLFIVCLSLVACTARKVEYTEPIPVSLNNTGKLQEYDVVRLETVDGRSMELVVEKVRPDSIRGTTTSNVNKMYLVEVEKIDNIKVLHHVGKAVKTGEASEVDVFNLAGIILYGFALYLMSRLGGF